MLMRWGIITSLLRPLWIIELCPSAQVDCRYCDGVEKSVISRNPFQRILTILLLVLWLEWIFVLRDSRNVSSSLLCKLDFNMFTVYPGTLWKLLDNIRNSLTVSKKYVTKRSSNVLPVNKDNSRGFLSKEWAGSHKVFGVTWGRKEKLKGLASN